MIATNDSFLQRLDNRNVSTAAVRHPCFASTGRKIASGGRRSVSPVAAESHNTTSPSRSAGSSSSGAPPNSAALSCWPRLEEPPIRSLAVAGGGADEPAVPAYVNLELGDAN